MICSFLLPEGSGQVVLVRTLFSRAGKKEPPSSAALFGAGKKDPHKPRLTEVIRAGITSHLPVGSLIKLLHYCGFSINMLALFYFSKLCAG